MTKQKNDRCPFLTSFCFTYLFFYNPDAGVMVNFCEENNKLSGRKVVPSVKRKERSYITICKTIIHTYTTIHTQLYIHQINAIQTSWINFE